MHIPDGFLDGRTALIAGGISAVAVGVALRQARRHLPRHRVPLMGLSAAFIFAAQMLNFPVLGGTSGHLIGAVLAAVLLGPAAALIVITAVLIVQCLMFADGGVLALGANVLNMGLIGAVGGGWVYRLMHRMLPGRRGQLAAIAFASWCATLAAAIVCAAQLAIAGAVSASAAFPAMAGIHMLIGVGEALITTLILAAISQVRPELLNPRALASSPAAPRGDVALGLLAALVLVVFVAPFASPWPDGLEHVAERLGFAHLAAPEPLVASPMPDYLFPGITSAGLATVLAGLVGTLVMFLLALALARALTPSRPALAPNR